MVIISNNIIPGILKITNLEILTKRKSNTLCSGSTFRGSFPVLKPFLTDGYMENDSTQCNGTCTVLAVPDTQEIL